MDRYDFITSKEDVVENIKTLYGYLGNPDDAETYKWATGILKNGRIYVVEVIDSKLYFAPSRFVGYKKNTADKHREHFRVYLNNTTCHQVIKSIGFQRI